MALDITTIPEAYSAAQMAGRDVPIDHPHLARYTLGNRALEQEVLQLFADQAPQTLASLAAANSAKAWHAAAHTLKGSAMAVGAWQPGKSGRGSRKRRHRWQRSRAADPRPRAGAVRGQPLHRRAGRCLSGPAAPYRRASGRSPPPAPRPPGALNWRPPTSNCQAPVAGRHGPVSRVAGRQPAHGR